MHRVIPHKLCVMPHKVWNFTQSLEFYTEWKLEHNLHSAFALVNLRTFECKISCKCKKIRRQISGTWVCEYWARNRDGKKCVLLGGISSMMAETNFTLGPISKLIYFVMLKMSSILTRSHKLLSLPLSLKWRMVAYNHLNQVFPILWNIFKLY